MSALSNRERRDLWRAIAKMHDVAGDGVAARQARENARLCVIAGELIRATGTGIYRDRFERPRDERGRFSA